MRILAGDIGGTHARLVYLQDDSESAIRHEKIYASADYDSLIEIIEHFLVDHAIQRALDSVCLAVAGPVVSGCASLTNLPWRVCEKELRLLLQTENSYLINDLVAVGYALPYLPEEALLVLQPGKKGEHEPITSAVVIGAGTGLGAAHLVSAGEQQRVLSSEAGHAAFSPANKMQLRLLEWLQQQYGYVSVEMLVSGRGIVALYRFFRDVVGVAESRSVRAALQRGDAAQIISEHAVAGDDLLSEQTLSCFIDIYAAAAGDITLHYFPVNAVYLAGGIAPKIQTLLLAKQDEFATCFSHKGAMQRNLRRVPIRLIIDEGGGLHGAIAYARLHCRST